MAQLVKKKNIRLQCRRPGFDPWVGKIPLVKGKGYPLQSSSLENPMDSIVREVAKSQIRLSDFHFHYLGWWEQGSNRDLSHAHHGQYS